MNKTLRISLPAIATTLLLGTAMPGFANSHNAAAEQDNYSDSDCFDIIVKNNGGYDATYCWERKGSWTDTTTPSGNATYNFKGTNSVTMTNKTTGEIVMSTTGDEKENYLIKNGEEAVSIKSKNVELCYYGNSFVTSFDYHFVGGEPIRVNTEYSVADC